MSPVLICHHLDPLPTPHFHVTQVFSSTSAPMPGSPERKIWITLCLCVCPKFLLFSCLSEICNNSLFIPGHGFCDICCQNCDLKNKLPIIRTCHSGILPQGGSGVLAIRSEPAGIFTVMPPQIYNLEFCVFHLYI